MAICSRPNVKFVVQLADDRGMAKISVVDGGTLIIVANGGSILSKPFGL